MAGEDKRAARSDDVPDPYTRVEHLVAMIDHCKAAKEAADRLDERFLAYLLGMAIQEAKATVRRAL